MIKPTLRSAFREVNDHYYMVIEYYHFQVLKSLLPSDMSLRDIFTIFVIHQQQKIQQNTSTTIAKLVGMSNSSFSNHLRIMEKNGVVQRHRDDVNRKLMVIELTPQGNKLHKSLMQYFKDLFVYIHKKIGLKGDVELLKAVLLVSNQLSNEPPLTAKLLQPKLFLDQVFKGLTRIFFYFSGEEQLFLERLPMAMTMREARFLQAIEEYSLLDQATPSFLANLLGHPMSTVTSLINALEKKKLVRRIEDHEDRRRYKLMLEYSALAVVESYMQFRVSMRDHIDHLFDASTQKTFNLLFEGIKEFSIQKLGHHDAA